MKLPPYPEFPRLRGNSILLRKIDPEEVEQLLPISFYDGKQAQSVTEAVFMLEKINGDYNRGESIHWGIEDISSGKLAGTCGFYRGFKNFTGEVGFLLLPHFRGRGIMTAALDLIIQSGFHNIGLEKIMAETSRQNFKAIKVLERSNFSKSSEIGESVFYQIHRSTSS